MLAARTEGWAAGLQLAGLSLRGQTDAAGFVAAFTGSHRSVLERLNGDLCDAVAGRPGSQGLLEQAERAGLFVVPLDEVRGWGATTTRSPTCSEPACSSNSPAGSRSCTATPPSGMTIMGWPMTPSATQPPPGRRPGPPG